MALEIRPLLLECPCLPIFDTILRNEHGEREKIRTYTQDNLH